MNNTGKIMTALAVGALAGTVAGLLFAPDKGSETRRKLKEKGEKLSKEMKEKLKMGKEKWNAMKEEAEELV